MRLRGRFIVLLIVILAIWMAYAMIASPITPQAWEAPPNPGLTGDFSPNDQLSKVATISMPAMGPEDVACDAEGIFYTGLIDGSILRWQEGSPPETITNTGGRPLGLVVDPAGSLVIADAERGLIKMDPDGRIQVLTDQYKGQRLRFVDDLAIEQSGRIWFSDASQRFGFTENLLDFFEGSMTGRLMSYDQSDGRVEVHMDGLFFANGVALGPDDTFVLVNETGLGRVHRYWLAGERAGTSELFIEHLPGTPDNINFDGEDTFWIAMPSLRSSIDAMAGLPWLRRMISVLPSSWLAVAADVSSFVVGVNLDGKITTNLQDPELGYNYITSATPCGDTLWLGSLHMYSVAKLPVPQTLNQ